MTWVAIILSAVALVASLSHWAWDWWTGNLRSRRRGSRHGRHEGVALRVELLAEGTNCFVIRGGYSLIFASLRVYNESEQRAATVARLVVELRRGRRWRPLAPQPNDDAFIFGSLARNALPMELAPGASEDIYEVFLLPDLIDQTNIRVRVVAWDYSGAHAFVDDTLAHRLDDRPPLDILFQTLDIRPSTPTKRDPSLPA
ncbi:hypothetical protein HN371_05050 [Candidatus Poribacteria bacterium]|nr:hypothetical protein [Candidatus Poribacteria bacterium]MBT5535128.1 hypothetical protein [Candidatus Poribacteria bacterium]MBT5709462.1 hypothetical protein [Candidatus Poribacteria bacterium]MBT7101422.1 hypothetical protein [Candidatus Poribacteria bacterium]MBT7805764.1 hypothetical protein [Candidatus Poribacteria bacterium]